MQSRNITDLGRLFTHLISCIKYHLCDFILSCLLCYFFSCFVRAVVCLPFSLSPIKPCFFPFNLWLRWCVCRFNSMFKISYDFLSILMRRFKRLVTLPNFERTYFGAFDSRETYKYANNHLNLHGLPFFSEECG